MPNLGMPELLIVLVIILVLFGANKLPQLAKGLGEGIRNFKDATREESRPADSTSPRDDAELKS